MSEAEDESYGGTVAKRRLSRRLVTMRGNAGYSANEVADKLNWNRGRLQRIEANQWRLPDPSHIRDLARIYGASEAAESELLELALQARDRQWWRSYEDVFGKDNEFPGYENDAARISVYMPLVLPGLLQIRQYTEAHMLAGTKPPQWRARALEARLRRQHILDRPHTAPVLSAVITEASLAYVWGPTGDRRAQVERLNELGKRLNVQIRLLRFEDGPHPGMSSLINLFDFPDPQDPGIVYLETDTAVQELTSNGEVQAYKDVFARICEAALPPAATRSYLEKLAHSLR